MTGFSLFDDRHRSEQYFTSFHTRDHFFRHVNGRPQTRHILFGKVALVKRLGSFLIIGAALRVATVLVAARPFLLV